MPGFNKIVRIGVKNRCGDVYVNINYGGGRLSITGVEGPMRDGKGKGGCGQITLDYPLGQGLRLAPGWTADMVARLAAIWDEWHLNDMRWGSPRQRAHLQKHPIPAWTDWFGMAKASLEAAGLEPDAERLHKGQPYRFGSAWLHEDVPEDVLEWLAALPDTDKQPAWV